MNLTTPQKYAYVLRTVFLLHDKQQVIVARIVKKVMECEVETRRNNNILRMCNKCKKKIDRAAELTERFKTLNERAINPPPRNSNNDAIEGFFGRPPDNDKPWLNDDDEDEDLDFGIS